jgi:putative acetyltransferase
MVSVRPELPEDREAVFDVNRRAFETPAEATLVDALRPVARPLISLVAVLDGRVVGHILFTPVTIEGGAAAGRAMALGPMAVLPELQNRDIGSRLVVVGLEACRDIGVHVVFVLGHREYYPRFGFEPAPPKGLRYKHADFDPYFMAVELSQDALSGLSGNVKYHPQFDAL